MSSRCNYITEIQFVIGIGQEHRCLANTFKICIVSHILCRIPYTINDQPTYFRLTSVFHVLALICASKNQVSKHIFHIIGNLHSIKKSHITLCIHIYFVDKFIYIFICNSILMVRSIFELIKQLKFKTWLWYWLWYSPWHSQCFAFE